MSAVANDLAATPETVCHLVRVAVGAGYESVTSIRGASEGDPAGAVVVISRRGRWFRVRVDEVELEVEP